MDLETNISGPIAVIGDVHGQVDKLGIILDRIQDAPRFDERWIVFVGDFVDRGPETRETIDMILEFVDYHPRTTAVAGNHDFAMCASLGLIPAPEYSNWAGRWIDHYDSEATFASYDVPFGDLKALKEALPEAHRDFLANLPWVVEHPDYLVVHAGLDPLTPTEMQLRILRQKDFSLNRPQWLCEKNYAEDPVPDDCRQTVVSGHVWFRDVIFGDRRILCDTTGGREGALSAVLLPERQVLTSSRQRRAVSAPPPQPVGYSREPDQARSWWKFW
ncbi:metallophosphoesterase [Rubinisphaera margarita]|uniref:metallophosphoesterase n=1 Tax=Rubinisphaera margarita TaxID=2909586 RepID=UPI001EE89AD5|nr:metallophosphoesterase [Rubinisphaera margarita]MCG6158054.1 metallophosphoesterase [Rubinisphaera margarita]